jgi:hypothetical protein
MRGVNGSEPLQELLGTYSGSGVDRQFHLRYLLVNFLTTIKQFRKM